jgi:uncharacterized membrane protein
MIESPPTRQQTNKTSRALVLWAHWQILWLSKHWLAVFNGFFFIYIGLPFLAPILLANGYTGAANNIYSLYRLTCHQLPSRAYFIAGEQVAICHRDVSIYLTLLLGGLLFSLVRYRPRPLRLRWYVFFMVPIALDGGLSMASEWLQFTTMLNLWIIGLIAMGITSAILHSQKYLTWHSYLFFAFGPLALVYLQYFGPYQSDWLSRTLTGFIFGAGTIWFAYPEFEKGFNEIRKQVIAKLAKAYNRPVE